jgi:two-component system, cell cycle response regulator DivK
LAGLILTVEDDETTLKLLRDIFQIYGYRVIEAIDGNEAISRAINEKPDLITMDMQLPGLNGMEVTKVIKANPLTKHIPIIAVTASAMKGQDIIVLQAGCDSHVSKPFDIDALIKKIKNYLPSDREI